MLKLCSGAGRRLVSEGSTAAWHAPMFRGALRHSAPSCCAAELVPSSNSEAPSVDVAMTDAALDDTAQTPYPHCPQTPADSLAVPTAPRDPLPAAGLQRSFYKRELPNPPCTDFSSDEGTRLCTEPLAVCTCSIRTTLPPAEEVHTCFVGLMRNLVRSTRFTAC